MPVIPNIKTEEVWTPDFAEAFNWLVGDMVKGIMERPVAGATNTEPEQWTRDALRNSLTAVRGEGFAASALEALDKREVESSLWKTGYAPPTFPEFCAILDKQPLYPHQLRCIEESGLVSPYDLIDPNRTRQVLLFIWGKGSGKDYMCAKFCAWISYVLNSLSMDPAEYLGLAPASRVSILNIASTKDQAKNVFFAQYLKRFIKHKIFREAGFITDTRDGGKQIQGDKVLFFRYDAEGTPYESVGLFSMTSSLASNEGHNVFAFVMDEADAFHDAEDKSNADDLYNVFTSSATTRFQSRYVGMIISYPRTENGFVMRLKKVAERNVAEKGDRANYYVDLAPTDRVNPRFDITNDVVQQHFKDNPLEARAMYLCIPAGATEAFFEFPERIEQSIDHKRQACAVVELENYQTTMQNGSEMFYVNAVLRTFVRTPGFRYFMSGDAGAKNDAYALTIWHYDANTTAFKFLCPRCGTDASLTQFAIYDRLTNVTGRFNITPETQEQYYCGSCTDECLNYSGGGHGRGTVNMAGWYMRSDRDESSVIDGKGNSYTVKKLYEDLIIQVKPHRAVQKDDANRLVYFPGIQTLCRELIQGLGIQAARFDPWQTYEITQGLIQSTGKDVAEISYSRPDQYKRARWAKKLLYGGMLHFLPHEDRDREWRQLQDIKRQAVDHPKEPGASKDIFDAESACIWACSENLDTRLNISFL